MRSKLFACTLSASLFALTPSLAAAEQAPGTPAASAANPLLADWTTPDGVPPYDRILPEDYEPAFDTALAAARADYRRIADNKAAPTFANTIEAMEGAGRPLGRISSAFFNVASADATDAIQAIEKAVTPKLMRLNNETLLDQKLFARVDTLWKARATLKLIPEQARLLEETHKRFVRAGAALSPEVAGLPDDQKSAAAAAAKKAERDGFLFPATRSAAEPFLIAAPNRGAREKIWRAFTMRGDNGNANDTNAIIAKLVALRIERAKLMGAESHAVFVLEDSMAKTPAAATDLMMQVYTPALARARRRNWSTSPRLPQGMA